VKGIAVGCRRKEMEKDLLNWKYFFIQDKMDLKHEYDTYIPTYMFLVFGFIFCVI